MQFTMFHTYRELILSVRAGFDLSTLSEEQKQGLLQDQYFRIIIAPGEYLEDGRVNGGLAAFSDMSYKEALKKFKLSEENVTKLNLK